MKHDFVRAIKSPRKSFGEGNEEGEGDRPRQTKRPDVSIFSYLVSNQVLYIVNILSLVTWMNLVKKNLESLQPGSWGNNFK